MYANESCRELGCRPVNDMVGRVDVLNVEAAVDHWKARGLDLSALLLAASTLREQGKGQKISYSPKVFIPLTNMCRDRCGYCTFVKSPTQIGAHLMIPEEVLDIAQRGANNGCKEALFSLGDHPEWRHSEAMEQLKNLGYRSTPEYLAAMCRLVLEQTGLLPHSNCGVLDIDELRMLREVNVSMGLMLENVSERLLNRGGPHFGADSKRPSLRLETLCLSGEMDLAMTTGILIGIVVAIIVGIIIGGFAPTFAVKFTILGDIFLNSLKMMVVPLVILSMIVGITGLGDIRSLGSIGGRTVGYYMTTTAISVILGVVLVNIIRPGVTFTIMYFFYFNRINKL
mgnify:CR=1 FL=1